MTRRLTTALTALVALPSLAHASGGVHVPMPVNMFGFEWGHDIILVSALTAVVIFLIIWRWTRNLSLENPGRAQTTLEFIIGAFDDLCNQSLGAERGRKYLPWIGTLFIFIWVGNMMGLPGMLLAPVTTGAIGEEAFTDYNHNHHWDPGEPFVDANNNGIHDPGFPTPLIEEPTTNLNVTLGLALLFVFLIGHGSEIRFHGVIGYIKSYFSPGGFIGLAMFPLNLVGKLAELISISFRLFGNIFGGVVIINVVSGLLAYLVVPIGLFGFFILFVGTVQAFVFTMLALTYIAMGAAEEEEEEAH